MRRLFPGRITNAAMMADLQNRRTAGAFRSRRRSGMFRTFGSGVRNASRNGSATGAATAENAKKTEPDESKVYA